MRAGAKERLLKRLSNPTYAIKSDKIQGDIGELHFHDFVRSQIAGNNKLEIQYDATFSHYSVLDIPNKLFVRDRNVEDGNVVVYQSNSRARNYNNLRRGYHPVLEMDLSLIIGYNQIPTIVEVKTGSSIHMNNLPNQRILNKIYFGKYGMILAIDPESKNNNSPREYDSVLKLTGAGVSFAYFHPDFKAKAKQLVKLVLEDFGIDRDVSNNTIIPFEEFQFPPR